METAGIMEAIFFSHISVPYCFTLSSLAWHWSASVIIYSSPLFSKCSY